MHVIRGHGLGEVYASLCELAATGARRSPRGEATRDAGAVTLELQAAYPHAFSGSSRSTDLAYLEAELRLYVAGEVKAQEWARHASLWGRIANPDGEINSAYGHRIWHRRFWEHRAGQRGRGQQTQWHQALRTLREDPGSRRAVLTLNLPEDHWPGNRDVPCTLSINLQAGPDDALDVNVCMRSWDVWYGVPYDVAFFAMVCRRMANELGIAAGRVRVTAWSLHAYESKLEAVGRAADDDTLESTAWADLPPGLVALLEPPAGIKADLGVAA